MEHLISQYFYGETFHFRSEHGEALEARALNPSEDEDYRYRYPLATIGLSHLYLGAAALTRAITPL